MTENVNIDTQIIFATGMSNGGKMTYRLACELSQRIAAIAVSGSSLAVSNCQPRRPVPLLAFHGTADTFSPYEGGIGTGTDVRAYQMGAPQTVDRWVRLNGCRRTNQVTFQKGDATCVTFSGCAEGAVVTFCTIKGMGHQWPGHTLNISRFRARILGLPEAFTRLGPGTNDLDATDMAVAFFRNHPMPQI